jgi:predicted nucleic acid-binding protein
LGSLILDATVLIGLLDCADAHHERAVGDVEAADAADQGLIAPASAYSEALVLRLPDVIVLACARELGGELLSYDERLTRTAQEP